MSARQAINDKLQGSVATHLRCGGVVNNTHTFNGPLSGSTRVSRYQKGKTNLDFTEARDSEWQCHQLGHMQVCTSLQTDNHANTPPLSFLQAGCPSCRPTNSVKALKGLLINKLRNVYCWVWEWIFLIGEYLAKLQSRTWLSRATHR